ncbi:MAG: antibiotic biosynthesis monooxygenase [Crocinitomicaceae bacterium]|nr:antibiotic biosynthesis monooxygenase [Crocinitomicaceae bacterium]MBK8924613.1 antibiotic biosynthesis monooxygenase [Crocinitomicaceae bacterium]
MALQRIVRLSFKPGHGHEFEHYFHEIKEKIAAQPGCLGVKLLRDTDHPGTYFTYSVWQNQEALDAYRTTDLFSVVWPKVKQWFDEKPQAWSTLVIAEAAV